MTKLTIEVSHAEIDAIIVDELKDAIKFCKTHQMPDFVVAMEKTMQFYMTTADYYEWVATQGEEND